MPTAARQALREATVHWVDAPRELGAGVGLVGSVPRRTARAGMGATSSRLLPCHCTGVEASQALRHAFPKAWSAGGAGAVLAW